MTDLAQLIINGLVTGSILALGGLGVTIIYGTLGVVNFAHGEYVTYGAFAAVLVDVGLGASMAFAVVAAVLAVALLSVVLERAFWRPMRRRRAELMTMFLASFGLSLVLRGVLYLIAGAKPQAFRVDLYRVHHLSGIRLSDSQLLAITIAAVGIAAVSLLFARTQLGRSMRAVADDKPLAAVAGIDTDRIILVTWVIAGALAGLAGVLQGLIQNSFDVNMGFTLLLPVFGAVILGGVGSAYGALAGGLTLGVAMELSTWQALGGGLSPVWKPLVAFVAIILVLLVRPTGFFGRPLAA